MPPAAIRLVLIASLAVIGLDLLSLAVRSPGLACVPLGILAWRRRHRWHLSDAYGSARSATLGELLSRGMIDDGTDNHRGGGQFLGSGGFLDPPGKAEGLKALLSPSLSSALACRIFFAAFLGRRWMEG